jgi:hypothetical protein
VERTDGTATLTATYENLVNPNFCFDATINFSGRTAANPNPGGELPNVNCGGSYTLNPSDFYYYPNMTGQLLGRKALQGAVIQVNKSIDNKAFQIGTGANLNEPNQLGAGSWLTLVVTQNLNGLLNSGNPSDINMRVSGAAGTPCPITTRSEQVFRIEGSLEKEVINLTWYNNTGNHNEHFEVERSIDGGKTFTSILRENNRTASSKLEIFKGQDVQPVEGNNTYRLVTYMQDGIIKYSDEVMVAFRQATAIEVYPNPADDFTVLQLGKVKEVTSVDLFDNAGRLVRTVSVSGEQTIRMDNLESGFYTIIVRTQAGTVATKKLVVNRNF